MAARFANYETVEELSRSGTGQLWRARAGGDSGDPAFVIKTCEPNAFILGQEQAGRLMAN